MTNHYWGDKDFDWAALDEANHYTWKRCRQFGRVGIHIKEKFGTTRISTTGAFFSEYDFIHHWFYPGYVCYQFPRWFRTKIDWPVGKVMKWLGVVKLLQWYQVKVLKFFWQRAAKKWPQVAEEILDEWEFHFNE